MLDAVCLSVCPSVVRYSLYTSCSTAKVMRMGKYPPRVAPKPLYLSSTIISCYRHSNYSFLISALLLLLLCRRIVLYLSIQLLHCIAASVFY